MATPYETAARMAGSREGQAALTDYLRTGGQNIDPQMRAWCADFVNATLAKAGQQGTDSGLARSFLQWGQEVSEPEQGDIAVFSRGDPDGWQGHVGFYAGETPEGDIRVLGGNQSDSVSYANYSPDDLLGYRRAGDGSGGATQQDMAVPGSAGYNPHAAAGNAPAGPSSTFGTMAPMASQGVPAGVAKYAASDSDEGSSFGDRLTKAGKFLDAFTPDPPRLSRFGDARKTGNALLEVMNNPTAADMLLRKRLRG